MELWKFFDVRRPRISYVKAVNSTYGPLFSLCFTDARKFLLSEVLYLNNGVVYSFVPLLSRSAVTMPVSRSLPE